MRTGLPAALLRGTPSAIRDDRFTRCPFPAATTHAPVALARSSNTAMEHRNRCTVLCFGHPAVQHYDLNGTPHAERVAVLCPIRARGYFRAHPRQDRGLQAQG